MLWDSQNICFVFFSIVLRRCSFSKMCCQLELRFVSFVEHSLYIFKNCWRNLKKHVPTYNFYFLSAFGPGPILNMRSPNEVAACACTLSDSSLFSSATAVDAWIVDLKSMTSSVAFGSCSTSESAKIKFSGFRSLWQTELAWMYIVVNGRVAYMAVLTPIEKLTINHLFLVDYGLEMVC